jgi:hypothetical protein
MHLMEYSPQASRESSSSSPPLAAAAAAAVGVPPWEDGARCSCPLPLLPNSARVALGVPAAVMRRGTPTVTASCAAADSSRSRAAAMNLQRRRANGRCALGAISLHMSLRQAAVHSQAIHMPACIIQFPTSQATTTTHLFLRRLRNRLRVCLI